MKSIAGRLAICICGAGLVFGSQAYAGDDIERGSSIEGRRLFVQQNCYICHGGRGGGGMAPNLRDHRPNDNDIVDALVNGRPSGMPSYRHRLTDADIGHIISYLRSLRDDDEPVFTHWWEPIPSQ